MFGIWRIEREIDTSFKTIDNNMSLDQWKYLSLINNTLWS